MVDYCVEAGSPARLGVTKNGKDLNFAVVVRDGKNCSLLLYEKGSEKTAQKFPFTEQMRFGDIYAMQISGLHGQEWEYNYEIDGEIVLDPYAVRISGREEWGICPEKNRSVRGVIRSDRFSWQIGRAHV